MVGWVRRSFERVPGLSQKLLSVRLKSLWSNGFGPAIEDWQLL